MNKSTVEWIVLPGDIAIVATETGQVWQLALGSFGENNPFKKEMVGKGSARSTAALLNQAIAAGFGHQEQEFPRRSNFPSAIRLQSCRNLSQCPQNAGELLAGGETNARVGTT